MKKILWLILCLFSLDCLADVPYILKNGDIADATTLNANFSDLAKEHKKHDTFSGPDLIGSSTVFWVSNPGGGLFINIMLYFNPSFDPVKINAQGQIFSHFADEIVEIDSKPGRYFIFYMEPDETLFTLIPAMGKIVISNSNTAFYYPPFPKLVKFPGNSSLYIEVFENNPKVTGIKVHPIPNLKIPDLQPSSIPILGANK